MSSQQSGEGQRLRATHNTTSAASPAGSLRDLLSRTLTRGRSSEHTARRKHKSRLSSPVQDVQQTTSSPTTSQRPRSISWSAQGSRKLSKDGKYRLTRTCSAKHPPPFAEAFRHAIVHAKLETPVANADARKNKSVANSPAVGTDTNASPLLAPGVIHSMPADCHLASKVFILTDDGCILQYRADGASNRTPERFLELGPHSTSVASDAISGKHWVLSITSNGMQEPTLPNTGPRPSRSRLFLRQNPELKRNARELLLVFSNDCAFNQWLIYVRKEIEALGGLEYRPDSRGANNLLQMARGTTRTEAIPSRNISPAESRRTSRLVNEVHHTNIELASQEETVCLAHSTTGSSLGSTTELDKLRASVADVRSLGGATVSTQAEVVQDHIIPDINVMDSEEPRATSGEAQILPSAKRKKNLAPILVFPPMESRSTSYSPKLPSPKFPRTPTLALDTVHSMAGAFGKPISPVTPTTPFQSDHTPFSFMHGFDFTPYNGPELTPTLSTADDASFSSVPPPSRCSHSFESHSPRHQSEFDNFAGDCGPVSVQDSREDLTIDRISPPPAYTRAPQRKSSLDFRQKTSSQEPSIDALVGLGITGHARSGSGLTPFVFPSRARMQGMRPSGSDVDEMSPVDSAADFQLKETALPLHERSSSIHRIGRQKSMPNLTASSGRPVAPPPSVPLPAVPYHDAGPLFMRRNRSTSPPSTLSSKEPRSREAKPTALNVRDPPGISPLASNPVSPVELTFARRLLIVNGMPAVEAAPPLPSPKPEVPVRIQKRSISKSPPPSTWDAWKAFPTLKASIPSSRPDSGVFRAATMPTATKQSPNPVDDPVASVATRIDEFLMMRHRTAAGNVSNGCLDGGHDTRADHGRHVDGAGAARQRTVEVDGHERPTNLTEQT